MSFSSSHRHSTDIMEALKEEKPPCIQFKEDEGSFGPHKTCMPCSNLLRWHIDSPGPLSGVQCCLCRIFMWMRGSKASPPLEPCLSFQK